MEKILDKINKKENLTFDESKIAFGAIMTGKADESKIYLEDQSKKEEE